MLACRHLVVRFSSVTAVDDVSFDVHRGEVFTLLGSSGCGKTTILRTVAGLEEQQAGEVWLRGECVGAPERGIWRPTNKRNLGMVFQSYAVWPHMTVGENVAYPLVVRKVGRAEIRERVGRVLAIVGLDGLAERPASHLSGGQQQRVALARALVYSEDFIVLDEPFSNLDAQLRRQLRGELQHLQRSLGIAALFVTHDQEEAMMLSNRVAVMSAGRFEQVGTPRELYEEPATAFVRDFLGTTILLDAVVEHLGSEGLAQAVIAGEDGDACRVVIPSREVTAPGPCVVAFRPEAARLEATPRPTPADGVAIPVRCVNAQYMGDRWEVLLRLRSRTFQIPQQAIEPPPPGTVGYLVVEPERLRAWPA
jgi:ABC-type Fe3+/spermidine/putrescine transport system ATPase subunit